MFLERLLKEIYFSEFHSSLFNIISKILILAPPLPPLPPFSYQLSPPNTFFYTEELFKNWIWCSMFQRVASCWLWTVPNQRSQKGLLGVHITCQGERCACSEPGQCQPVHEMGATIPVWSLCPRGLCRHSSFLLDVLAPVQSFSSFIMVSSVLGTWSHLVLTIIMWLRYYYHPHSGIKMT